MLITTNNKIYIFESGFFRRRITIFACNLEDGNILIGQTRHSKRASIEIVN